MPKKFVHKIGSTVKIINPLVFKRCGYKLGIEEGVELITLEEKNQIAKIIGYDMSDILAFNYSKVNSHKCRSFDKILQEIAYCKIRALNFGGRERGIRTEDKKELLNQEYVVIQKKVVQTGTYYPGGGGIDYYTGEYDYCPAYLQNVKAHVILGLSKTNYIWSGPDFWIEEKNVVSVNS